ncbi:MAG: AAA family ATPase [Paludibacter sp.]|jgi:predicted ATPase|nr:AAA family ATPase [Paludibacter sp.]
MAINKVEIKDFLVFKGNFTAEFCSGVNVLIGGNGTGKTTILKCLSIKGFSYFDLIKVSGNAKIIFNGRNVFGNNIAITSENYNANSSVYIPEKDILEHAKGLLTFIETKETGFSPIYRDVLIKAQDVPTSKQSETQQRIGKNISDIIGGEVKWDKGDGSFYTIKVNGDRIPFANEASGFKKLGFLGLLVACGQMESGDVLFWDEPENSLNPELIPVLVDILLELSRNGVQIFIATHSYTFARYFDINKRNTDKVMFYNLSKEDNGTISAASSSEYTNLSKSILENANKKLFQDVVANAMEVQKDEQNF